MWIFLLSKFVHLTLCGFYYGAFHVESCHALHALFSCFCSPFSTVITSLGAERAGLCASSDFCLCCTQCFCHLSLSGGAGVSCDL